MHLQIAGSLFRLILRVDLHHCSSYYVNEDIWISYAADYNGIATRLADMKGKDEPDSGPDQPSATRIRIQPSIKCLMLKITL